MLCDALVSPRLQALGGRCEVLCKYSMVVHKMFFSLVCQETDHCKTVACKSHQHGLESILEMPPAQVPLSSYYQLIQSFNSVELFPVDTSMKMLSIAICNRSVCFGNLWCFPVKHWIHRLSNCSLREYIWKLFLIISASVPTNNQWILVWIGRPSCPHNRV